MYSIYTLKSKVASFVEGMLRAGVCCALSIGVTLADGVGFNRAGQITNIYGYRALSGRVQEVGVFLNSGERVSVDIQKTFEEAAGTAVPLNVQINSPSGVLQTYVLSPSGTMLNSYVSDPVTETGIYTVRLDGQNRKLYWRYDINALPNGGTSYLNRIGGRVFTETLLLGQLTGTTDFGLFHLNQLGHQYASNFYGFNGIDSKIVTDIFGVTNGAVCEPLYKSSGYISQATCGRNYKQFFTNPDPSLPATANRLIGSTTTNDWLKPILATPAVSIGVLQFATSGSPLTPAKGVFTIPITGFSEIATLLIDVNGNNIFDEAIDRRIPFLSGNDVEFDGLDGQGGGIGCGTTMNAKVLIDKASEIHFVLDDVERLGGLKITRQNGAGSPSSVLYWDDTSLNTVNAATDPPLSSRDGTSGVNSDVVGGVHGWVQPGAGPDFSWGNNRLIDNWATYPIANTERSFQFVSAVCPPVANDDDSFGNPTGAVVTLNILSNDNFSDGSPAIPSASTVTLTTTGLPAGSSVSSNTLTVPGEGVYQYDFLSGNLTFTPNPGFVSNPTPITYILTESATGLIDPAVVTISYNAMPVRLVSFQAVRNESGVELVWYTAEEENSAFFEIQRSMNGRQWEVIGMEQANKESRSIIRYSYYDQSPTIGTVYYRLKMVDLDKTFAYSNIRSLSGSIGAGLVTYPVPARDLLLISVFSRSAVTRVQIYNLLGTLVYQASELPATGVDVTTMTSGLYILRLTLADGSILTDKISIAK